MRKILIIVVVLAILAGAVWLSVAWEGSPPAVWGWSASRGVLVVPSPGLTLMPRWIYRRVPAGPVTAEVTAATKEGVRIGVAATLTPPQGRWLLGSSSTPQEALASAVSGPARAYLASIPLSCFVQGKGGGAGCPADPAAVLRLTVADAVHVPHGALKLTLQPDAEAIQAYLIEKVRQKLPKVHRKVLVIGLDALGWDLVLPLVKRGLMPNMARLMNAGTWGPMKTIVPILSPLIWTTMATGVSPDVHGILDFAQRDPKTGQIMPITSKQRKVPAIWNMASAMGKTTDVVAWWATWPAERINGVMVSDRLYYSLTAGMHLKQSITNPLPDLVYPPEETQRFLDLRKRAEKETDWRTIRYFINIPEAEYDASISKDVGWQDPIDGFRRMFIATRLYFGSALMLAADHPDLLMVYIEGTDEIGHIMAPYVYPPTLHNVSPERAAILAASVPRYHQIVDRWIGRLLKVCPLDQYTVFIMSDHGFRWGKTRPRGLSGTAGPTAPMWHKQPASFLLAGKGIKRLGHITKWQSVYDVTPTLAALLGIPPDQRWRGHPLPGCPPNPLPPIDWSALVPPSSYQIGKNIHNTVSKEYIAKMKSLGYLSGGGNKPLETAGEAAAKAKAHAAAQEIPATPTPAPPASTPATSGQGLINPKTMTLGQLNNLAVIKINEKKYDEAIALLNRAIKLNPTGPGPHYNLRRIYMETGRYDDADRELWIAIKDGLRDRERVLDRAAADYESLSLPQRTEALLEKAVKMFPQHDPFWGHLIEVKIRLHDCPGGVEVGREAVKRFPNSAPIRSFYGVAAACAGDIETAREQFTASLKLDPNQPTIREMLQKMGGPPAGQ